MELQQKQSQEKPSHWWAAAPAGIAIGILASATWLATEDALTISKQEVREAIYEKYGDCLTDSSFTLGRVAVEYTDDVARVAPTDVPDSAALVFNVERSISNKPLPRPDEATQQVLNDLGCESQKPFWAN